MRCRPATVALAVLSFGTASLATREAATQYVPRYAATEHGALTMTGNSLGLSSDGGAGPGTIGSVGAFITTDITLAAPGGWPSGTTTDWSQNSAQAELRLPVGAEVLHAELIWGGYCEHLPAILAEPVRVTPPGGEALFVDAVEGVAVDDPSKDFYARAVDVTALVAAYGAGPWVVGHVPASLGCGADCNLRSVGWTLIVAYRRADLPLRDLGIWVGLEAGGGAPVTLAGLCTPSAGEVRARVLVSAIEGDFQGYGDNLAFGPVGGPLTHLSGPNNALNNFFAAHLNGDAGLLDTAGSFGGANLMSGATGTGRHGWDITNVDASGILTAGATAASAQGVTSNEQYRITTVGLQIDTGQPRFEAPATAATVTPATAALGESVVLGWVVTNTGAESAVDATLELALPAGLSAVPGGFARGGVPQPGVDPTAGPVVLPDLAPGASVALTVAAAVAVDPEDDVLSPIATLVWHYVACGVPATGQTSVNPAALPLARLEVTLTVAPTAPVAPGDTVALSATVTNVGAGPSRAASLAVAWAAGLDYVAGTTRVNGGARADVDGGSPFATAALIGGVPLGVLAPGASAGVTWQLRAADSDVRRDLSVTVAARGHRDVAASEAVAAVVVVVTVCGDGLLGGAEACDAGALNSDSAPDACRSDCTVARCGDGVRDANEACDDGGHEVDACAYGEVACVVCGTACDEVAGRVRRCGDRVVQADEGEGCDAGEENSDTAPDGCRSDCQPARCGDGVQDSGERCDDGDDDDDDGCDRACDDRRCGNGRVEVGEVCDGGPEPQAPCAYGDAACVRCEGDCSGWIEGAASYCGDWRLDAAHGESCDDGNDVTELCSYGLAGCAVCGAGCRPVAGIPTFCGDGSLDSVHGEQCDDGNRVDGDGCSAACVPDTARQTDAGGGCAGGAGAGPLALALAGLVAALVRRSKRSRLAPRA